VLGLPAGSAAQPTAPPANTAGHDSSTSAAASFDATCARRAKEDARLRIERAQRAGPPASAVHVSTAGAAIRAAAWTYNGERVQALIRPSQVRHDATLRARRPTTFICVLPSGATLGEPTPRMGPSAAPRESTTSQDRIHGYGSFHTMHHTISYFVGKG